MKWLDLRAPTSFITLRLWWSSVSFFFSFIVLWLWRSSYIFYSDAFSWNHWYALSVWLDWFWACTTHFFQIFKNKICYIALIFCCRMDILGQLWKQWIWVKWLNSTSPEAPFQVIFIQHTNKLLQQDRKCPLVVLSECNSLTSTPSKSFPSCLQWSTKRFIQQL